MFAGFFIQEIYFLNVRLFLLEGSKKEPVIVTLVLGLLLLLVAIKTMAVDTGVKVEQKIPRNVNFVKDERPVIDEETRMCRICNFSVTLKTHHCKYCNKCVESFDHHCVFLSYCIGKKNYKLYILCLILSEVLLCCFIYFQVDDIIRYLSLNKYTQNKKARVIMALNLLIFLIFTIIPSIAMLYNTYLLIFHMKITILKHTTFTYLMTKNIKKLTKVS